MILQLLTKPTGLIWPCKQVANTHHIWHCFNIVKYIKNYYRHHSNPTLPICDDWYTKSNQVCPYWGLSSWEFRILGKNSGICIILTTLGFRILNVFPALIQCCLVPSDTDRKSWSVVDPNLSVVLGNWASFVCFVLFCFVFFLKGVSNGKLWNQSEYAVHTTFEHRNLLALSFNSTNSLDGWL